MARNLAIEGRTLCLGRCFRPQRCLHFTPARQDRYEKLSSQTKPQVQPTASCGRPHPKGLGYVGGNLNGKRLTRHAKPTDIKFLCTASWRICKGDAPSSPR